VLLFFEIRIISKWIKRSFAGEVIEKQKFKTTSSIILFICFLAIIIIPIIERGLVSKIDMLGIQFYLGMLLICINDKFTYIELRKESIVTKYNVISWDLIENVEYGEKVFKGQMMYRYAKVNVQWKNLQYSIKIRDLSESMITIISSKCKVLMLP